MNIWQRCYHLCGNGNVTSLSSKGLHNAGAVFLHKGALEDSAESVILEAKEIPHRSRARGWHV